MLFFTREESPFQMTLDQVKVKTFSKSKQISSAFENDCHHFKLDSHAQRDYYQLLVNVLFLQKNPGLRETPILLGKRKTF